MQSPDTENSPDKTSTEHSEPKEKWLRNTLDRLSLAGAVGIILTFISILIPTLTFVLYNSFDREINSVGRDIDSVGRLVTANAEAIGSLTSTVSKVNDRVVTLNDTVKEGVVDNSRIVAEINASYRTQNNELVRLKEDLQKTESETNTELDKLEFKAAQDLEKVEREADKIGESISEISDTIQIASNVSAKVDDNQSTIEDLSVGISSTEQKINKLELILKLGIANPNITEALISLVNENKENFADLGELENLWNSKGDVTPQEMEAHLLATYNVNAKDALLIAYDDLSVSRPLAFFLQKKDIRSIVRPDAEIKEPELGTALPDGTATEMDITARQEESALVNTYKALEEIDLDKVHMTISDVCKLLPRTPNTECYRMFLENLNEPNGKSSDKSQIVESAVVKALVDKYEIVD